MIGLPLVRPQCFMMAGEPGWLAFSKDPLSASLRIVFHGSPLTFVVVGGIS